VGGTRARCVAPKMPGTFITLLSEAHAVPEEARDEKRLPRPLELLLGRREGERDLEMAERNHERQAEGEFL